MARGRHSSRGGLDRRSFGKGLLTTAAAVAGGALAAAPAGVRAQAPKPVPSRTLERQLVVSGRGGAFGAPWRDKVVPAFERKFGCKVTLVVSDSVPGFAKVAAEKSNPQTDVLWTTDQTHAQGVALGLFEKLDPERLTNLGRCYDFAKYDDGIGALFAVGACVLGYNTKVYREKGIAAPVRWNDVFQPAIKGHLIWMDLTTLNGVTAFLMLNKLHGGSETNVDPGFKLLKENFAQVLAMVSSPPQVDELFLQGEGWLTANSAPRIDLLKRKGFPIDLVYPEDGIPQIGVVLDVVKGAPHPNLAQEFVNWVLSEEMQRVIATEMASAPVNKDVKLPAEVASGLVYGPEKVAKLMRFDYQAIHRNFSEWLDRWNREFAR
jgi:putative spermidine/putrescine transport system substrate-binding protein